MARAVPYLRSPLRPFLRGWTAGLGSQVDCVQIGLWARWATQASGRRFSYQDTYLYRPTLLSLESPYSILPRGILTRWLIHWVPMTGTLSPAPAWRGVPTRWGHALIWLQNSLVEATHPEAWMSFSVLTLLPDHDPPDLRTPHLLLGSQFFMQHSRLRLSIRYGDIQRDPSGPGPDSRIACGEIRA